MFHGSSTTTPEPEALISNPWGSNSAEYDNYFRSPARTPPSSSGSPSSVSSDLTVKTTGLRVQTEGLSQPTPVPALSAINSPTQVPLPPSALSAINSPTHVPLPPSAVSASNSPTQEPLSAASSRSFKFPFDWEL